MNLFSFFKKTDKVGADSAIDSNQLVQDTEASSDNKEVTTKLSLHPEWNVPLEQQYVFSFLANELEPLKPNQLSLAAINIEEDKRNGAWYVKAFFRSSIPNNIELGEIGLIIVDKDGKRLASKEFDFKELGTLPPESARPWVFKFEKEYLETKEMPEDGWTIAFNLIALRGHQLELDESWKKQLPQNKQELLAKIVKDLPKLGRKEVNFTGLQARVRDDNSLMVSIFIRNGNDQAINLEQLPLEIIDANGKLVAKGSFKMNPALTVQGNSTKPWTFIFPAKTVNAEGADLSRWTAKVVQ
ncbi:accessory Sec system S-layer assembly protein [Lysinibacillus telephonicus]|uniref:accessory Sec system S-layer assembly protein n=1 Tax=Lysinibacillus telephonicus TaxID=1714840 RepID=UPI00397DBB45